MGSAKSQGFYHCGGAGEWILEAVLSQEHRAWLLPLLPTPPPPHQGEALPRENRCAGPFKQPGYWERALVLGVGIGKQARVQSYTLESYICIHLIQIWRALVGTIVVQPLSRV